MRTFPERKTRRARIEIIPMIDVMMFLLVFFVLISTNVLPARGLNVAVPGAARPDRIKDEKTRITLLVDRDGTIFVEGKPVPMAQLAASLRTIAAGRQAQVLIAGDQSTPLQTLVALLDQLKAAGLPAASVITKPTP